MDHRRQIVWLIDPDPPSASVRLRGGQITSATALAIIAVVAIGGPTIVGCQILYPDYSC